MTSTIANRRTSSPASPATAPLASAAAPPATPAQDGASDLGVATPAATFTPAARSSVPAGSPFNPPRTPALLVETKGMTSVEREATRTENKARIGIYNDQYAGYLDRYAEAVKSAPDLETVRGFGPPVSYDPEQKLPVKQRAQYDDLIRPDLGIQKPVHMVLGARVLQEKGVELPSVHAFFEVQVTRMGNGFKGRVEGTDEGVKTTQSIGLGWSSAMLGESKTDIGATSWMNAATGDAVSTELEGSNGEFWGALEASVAGEVSAEGGVMAGDEHANVKAGMHIGLNAAESHLDLAPVVGVALLGNEARARVGVGIQGLSQKMAKAAIDGGDFFADKAQVLAQRSGGR